MKVKEILEKKKNIMDYVRKTAKSNRVVLDDFGNDVPESSSLINSCFADPVLDYLVNSLVNICCVLSFQPDPAEAALYFMEMYSEKQPEFIEQEFTKDNADMICEVGKIVTEKYCRWNIDMTELEYLTLDFDNIFSEAGYDSFVKHSNLDQNDLKPEDFTIEPCPWCGREQVIHVKGITRCVCGKPLAPCTVCDYCNYSTCPYGCDGSDKDADKPCDYEALPDDMQAKLYAMI